MPLDLKLLRQVVALAEHGNFVRAASALHVSQPALSRSVQLAEHRIGQRLFERTSAGVVPTDVGRLYLERARNLLRMAEAFESEVGGSGARPRSRATVGGGPYPAESFLGPAAARLVERQPQTSVQIVTDTWDGLLQQLRGNRLDFFVAETSTLEQEADLTIEPFAARHSLYYFARAGHPLAGRCDVTAVEIAAWPFATPARVPPRILEPMLRAHRCAAQRGGAPGRFPALECDDVATAKRIVRSGNAISGSILSCLASELEAGEFVLLGTEPWLHLRYGIVSLRGHPWTPDAVALRGLVIEAEAAVSASEKRLSERFASAPGPLEGVPGVACGNRARPRAGPP